MTETTETSVGVSWISIPRRQLSVGMVVGIDTGKYSAKRFDVSMLTAGFLLLDLLHDNGNSALWKAFDIKRQQVRDVHFFHSYLYILVEKRAQ